jgi:hypothetical protein
MSSKPWYMSATVLSGLLHQTLAYFETLGVIPAGATQGLVDLIQHLTIVTGIFGGWRAVRGG